MMLKTILQRRKKLEQHFNVIHEFNIIEESCIPSYIHPNHVAALVAWLRLSTAAKLYNRHNPNGDILDFGSSSGEIYYLLNSPESYHFVEPNETLAKALKTWNPTAQRKDTATLQKKGYGAIFILDVLEHLNDLDKILSQLISALRPNGIMVLSGPTENILYRLGRKISGFGDYCHTTNIYNIESLVRRRLTLLEEKTVPFGLPLFRVSVWSLPK